MRLTWHLIFHKVNRTYSLVDRNAAICTSLASSVERFALAISIFGSLNWSFFGPASSFAVDVSAVSSLCCCTKKCLKPTLFWHHFVFTFIKRRALNYPLEHLFKLVSRNEDKPFIPKARRFFWFCCFFSIWLHTFDHLESGVNLPLE